MQNLINTGAIVTLASSRAQEVAAEHGVKNPDLSASMAELKAKRYKEATDAAASVILDVLGAATNAINVQAQCVAKFESDIKRAHTTMENINRAQSYGMETSNFVPLAAVLGLGLPSTLPDGVVKSVPRDWVPTPAAPAAVAGAAASDTRS